MRKLSVVVALVIGILYGNAQSSDIRSEASTNIGSLKTFGTMGKELKVLKRDVETELFDYEGKGALTHMWFGGSQLDHIEIKV